MERVESLSRQYLRRVSEQNEESGMESYRSRILQKNRVDGLLQMDKRYLDGICYQYYDITSMGSMGEMCAGGKITEKCLEEMFDGLETALQDMEVYLLKQSDLCLKPEYIMKNYETGRWAFLYIPGYDGDQAADLEKLTEYLIEHLDYSDESLQEGVYELYNSVIQLGERAAPTGMIQLWKQARQERAPILLPKQKEQSATEERELSPQSETEEDGARNKSGPEKKRWRRKIYRTPYRGMEIKNVSQPPLTETL